MTRRAAPEPVLPVHQAFRRQVFRTAPGVRLTWEALGSGLQALNALHDAQPPRRVRAHPTLTPTPGATS